MSTTAPSIALAAAGTFRKVSETERGERSGRAAAGALVLHAIACRGEGGAAAFAARRASNEVGALPRSTEAALLRRILVLVDALPAPDVDARLATRLIVLACELERARRLSEADAAATLARTLKPGDSALALHGGRIARKLGDRDRALELYRTARQADADGPIARLAQIGEAVLAVDAEVALTRAIRASLMCRDEEAAAVGLEERAALRRKGGKTIAAARDLCLASIRFGDAVDRARVAHELATLMLVRGDSAATREALLAALALGEAAQKEHARSRLHTLARDLGDQVGARRWRSFARPSLVSLSAYHRGMDSRSSLAPRLARWREALSVRQACS